MSAGPKDISISLPTLGVTVYHLKYVFLESTVCSSRDLSRSSSIHEIENLQGPPGVIRHISKDTICPMDGRSGAAYVHYLEREGKGADHVGKATHVLSYCWSFAIGDIVDSLWHYCDANQLDPQRTYIWIDCLCINQHRVVEEKDNGRTGLLNFEKTFPQTLKKIGHLLAMMSQWQKPVYLTRVWCIFELYTAHTTDGCLLSIILPPHAENSLEQDVVNKGGGATIAYEALFETRIENAESSVESDRKAILELIESTVGYSAINQKVIELLFGWMTHILVQLIEQRANTEDATYASLCEWDGFILWKKKHYDTALLRYKKCLEIRKRILGRDHPDTATAHNTLSVALDSLGDHKLAWDHYTKGLNISDTVLGKEFVQPPTTYNGIAIVKVSQRDYDGAMAQYEISLAAQRLFTGGIFLNTMCVHLNIGYLLLVKGDMVGATRQFEECLTIQKSLVGEGCLSTAATHRRIASVLQKTRDYSGSLRNLQNNLATLGKDFYPLTRSCLDSLQSKKCVNEDSSVPTTNNFACGKIGELLA